MKKIIIFAGLVYVSSLIISCGKRATPLVTPPDLADKVAGTYFLKSLSTSGTVQQPITISGGSASLKRAGNSLDQVELAIGFLIRTAVRDSSSYDSKIFNLRQSGDTIYLYTGGTKIATCYKEEIIANRYNFKTSLINFIGKKGF
jgi:hypothetical protein